MPFLSIFVRWCNSGGACNAALFDVIWADGTTETLHYGTLPNSLTPRQREQLREARLEAEARRNADQIQTEGAAR